ncbi:Gfo/Idh/MocA family oxidoreductase [Campylobacter coli]|nr:Gfo/Idh/MocA family oxidoreductase [Campylobacter coli]EDO7779254.1 gfo/Idh/MocA family oxidoreductase [Campylobacter coli]EDO9515423.1 gfo/Idh/MocA family oxidoreductase [Campylobacter coli]EDO9816021.1 Gfo/Idh/MocA family oxidoreductase [Campylobacter coli]EFQ7842672.1 Gfo/Idh/MocA family oxidoreductase [Campylobacter coli]
MKVLIIGFGSIGKKHFLALNELGFLVDVLSKSYEFSHFEGKNFRLFKDLEELNLEDYDLFIIANITTSHFKTLEFLDQNAKEKIILVEKPLFQKDMEFIPSKNNQIYIAYLLRFHPMIQDLKQLIDEKEAYFAKFICNSYLPNWRKLDYRQNYSAKKELGGGVMLDLSHEIDLAFYFFKDLSLNFSQNLKISELEITSDDFTFLALSAKNTQIHIELDYFSKLNQRKILFHTKENSFEADLVHNKLNIYDKTNNFKSKTYENDTFKTLQNMYKAILEKDQNLCTLEEARRVLRLCDEARNG